MFQIILVYRIRLFNTNLLLSSLGLLLLFELVKNSFIMVDFLTKFKLQLLITLFYFFFLSSCQHVERGCFIYLQHRWLINIRLFDAWELYLTGAYLRFLIFIGRRRLYIGLCIRVSLQCWIILYGIRLLLQWLLLHHWVEVGVFTWLQDLLFWEDLNRLVDDLDLRRDHLTTRIKSLLDKKIVGLTSSYHVWV
jgi:hypothetical protein